MDVYAILIIVFWSITSLLAMIEYAPYCGKLTKSEQLAVGIILIIGGPIIAANTVIETLLECYIQDLRNDDDGFKR